MIHPSFGISAIYCAERYAKVRNWICLLLLMLKPLVEISTCTSKLTHIYMIGKMGQSTRSEDISLACSQGLDVDDDNETTLENIPAAGARIDTTTTNLHGHKWGWSCTCHQKTKHHLDVDVQILN